MSLHKVLNGIILLPLSLRKENSGSSRPVYADGAKDGQRGISCQIKMLLCGQREESGRKTAKKKTEIEMNGRT